MPCVTSMAVATMSGVSPPLKTGGVGVGLGAVSPSGVGVGDGITIGKGVGVGDGTARSGGSGGEVATGGGVAVVRSAGAGVAVGVAVVSSTGTGVAVAVSRARGVLVGVAVENENEAGVDVAVGASCAAAPRVGLAGPTPRASISSARVVTAAVRKITKRTCRTGAEAPFRLTSPASGVSKVSTSLAYHFVLLNSGADRPGAERSRHFDPTAKGAHCSIGQRSWPT